ncbi:MAG: urease accessory protein UreF [Pseudanabaena sp. ELA607]|jgi:urease accessory protein
MESLALLSLLQITNSALPIGAYSYSDGLEFLCDSGKITSAPALYHWLHQELNYGVIRLEAGILWRIYQANFAQDLAQVLYWNNYLSATRETEEMRLSSWQMGQSLAKLIMELDSLTTLDSQVKSSPINTTENNFLDEIFAKLPTPKDNSAGLGCNFATSYAIAASYWHIPAQAMLLGYLMSWATNAVNAGIKLIPLGQTVGQQLLRELHPSIAQAASLVPNLTDDDLENCGFGLALASMQHQVQYSRLFRS